MDAHAMIGYLIVFLYLAAFVIGAAALWKSRGAPFMYLLTMFSTFGSLAFAALYVGYVSEGHYERLADTDFGWAGAHINSAAVLIGFHGWRLRRPV